MTFGHFRLNGAANAAKIEEYKMAYCSGCGKEIPEEGKFCPGCGKAADGTPSASNGTSDPAKIIKEGDFRRWDKTFSPTEDAKLVLFCDRLEWNGKKKETIKIDDITNVTVGIVNMGANVPTLEFTDNTGKKRRFFRNENLGKKMVGVMLSAGGNNQQEITQFTNAQAEMETWRDAIDKLMGRL